MGKYRKICDGIEVELRMKVSEDTAKACLAMVEVFLNQNKNKLIEVKENPNGTNGYRIIDLNDIKTDIQNGWHDLRKNPDDLPTKEDTLYMISVVGSVGYAQYKNATRIGMYEILENKWTDENYNYLPESWEIVAWKEVDVFKEGKND